MWFLPACACLGSQTGFFLCCFAPPAACPGCPASAARAQSTQQRGLAERSRARAWHPARRHVQACQEGVGACAGFPSSQPRAETTSYASALLKCFPIAPWAFQMRQQVAGSIPGSPSVIPPRGISSGLPKSDHSLRDQFRPRNEHIFVYSVRATRNPRWRTASCWACAGVGTSFVAALYSTTIVLR